MPNFYYIDQTDDVLGPVTLNQLQQFVDAGLLPPHTQVCREGSEIWEPIAKFVRPKRTSVTEKTAEPAKATGSIRESHIFVAGLILIFGVFAGNIHVIRGRNLDSPRIVEKEKFGFSETFVDMDEITGMPMIAARSRFPIGCHILQREHLIERDSEIEARVRSEVSTKIEEAQREVQRLMRQ